jgi:hypothetical protein
VEKMAEIVEVECKYCGSYIDVAKAVKLNEESGEFEYACEGCAIQWKDKKRTITDDTII